MCVRGRAGTFHEKWNKNPIRIEHTNTNACAHAESGNAVSLHRRRRRFDSSTIYVRVFFFSSLQFQRVSFHLNLVYFSGSWSIAMIITKHKTIATWQPHNSAKRQERQKKEQAKQCETFANSKLHVRWGDESTLRKLTHTPIEQNALIHDLITRILRAYEIIDVVSRISAQNFRPNDSPNRCASNRGILRRSSIFLWLSFCIRASDSRMRIGEARPHA